MSKKLSTTLTLAVTALKNLEERKGASPYDICNYISSVYNIPKDVAKRKALVALKRGTSYGLLKETSGRYNLLTDTEKECLELTNQELGLLNLNCRKRRLERKRRLRGTCKQTVKGRISRRKKKNNSCKSSRGKINKKRNKKKKKRKGKSISKSRNKKIIKRSKSRRRNSTIKSGVCSPGGNRRARKTKSRSTSRSQKKRSRSNSRRSRSRKPSKGKRITRTANKLTSKSRSRKRSRSRSKSTSKRRIKKIKASKKTGKKKPSTSCECPTNPARKIVKKSTGNDNKKIDKPPKIKKENKQKKQKRVKKDKENKEPKKDNCLVNFLGVSLGNLI